MPDTEVSQPAARAVPGRSRHAWPARLRDARFRFLGRRLLWTGPTLLTVIVLTFALIHLAPGNPWDNSPGVRTGAGLHLSEGTIRNLQIKYGLDRAWWDQLGTYLWNILHLDFGDSYEYEGLAVRDLLLQGMPTTFALGAVAFGVIVVVGVGLGVLAAIRQGSPVDYLVTGLATLGASVPNFVVGIFLIALLSVGLNRWTGGAFFLPDGGFALDQHLILPVITLSTLPIAFIARLTRVTALETLRQDHVRTARAKGLTERAVLLRHVLKNSLVPVVTALGPLFAFLITGSVIVEQLYQIPGIGGAFVNAVTYRDYPMLLGTTVVYCGVVALANLAVDVVYAVVDPRIKVG